MKLLIDLLLNCFNNFFNNGIINLKPLFEFSLFKIINNNFEISKIKQKKEIKKEIIINKLLLINYYNNYNYFLKKYLLNVNLKFNKKLFKINLLENKWSIKRNDKIDFESKIILIDFSRQSK